MAAFVALFFTALIACADQAVPVWGLALSFVLLWWGFEVLSLHEKEPVVPLPEASPDPEALPSRRGTK